MPSDDSDGPSAGDIITYVGVPLAVAGIVPITYTAVSTLIYRDKLRKRLEESQANGKIRSSEIFNRVVEVQFPRYRLAAPDSIDGSPAPGIQQGHIYPRSGLPGGTWTFLTWHRQEIGTKTQRLSPGDEPHQPQAEIRFYELIERLYRLGAKAVPSGWEELRTRGTWTTRGLVLMKIGSLDALLIAALDESDGSLALQLGAEVDWPGIEEQQIVRGSRTNHGLLYPATSKDHPSRVDKGKEPQDNSLASAPRGKDPPLPEGNEAAWESTSIHNESQSAKHVLPVLCQFSAEGTVQCQWHETSGNGIDTSQSTIDFSHLRPDGDNSDQAVWFASCATAVQATRGPPILSFRIPDHIYRFARTCKLPCGVLERLGMAGATETGFREDRAKAGQGSGSVTSAMEEKATTTPPRWPIQKVAECGLRWLQAHNDKLVGLSLQDVVVTVLYQMVVDPPFAMSICKILNQWRTWTDNDYMRPEDMRGLRELQEIFAEASLLLAVIEQVSSSPRDNALFNVQSCTDTFKYVKLG
ncbi:hypothetical protein PG984_000485 [Apiospora sp. TS-2023a]